MRIGQRRKFHPPDPIGIRVGDRACKLQGQARLAYTTGARQREDPTPAAEVLDVGELPLAADKAG
jgi:hypothetical protein